MTIAQLKSALAGIDDNALVVAVAAEVFGTYRSCDVRELRLSDAGDKLFLVTTMTPVAAGFEMSELVKWIDAAGKERN